MSLSILLVAIGAILTFAMDRIVEGVNLDTVGIILMIVGAVGLLFSVVRDDDSYWNRRRGPRDE